MQPFSLFLMAAFYPTSLDEYCTAFGVSFFNLELKCVFCKHRVPLQGLADFFVKGLSLVWKDEICYACCQNCLKHIAKYECENYTRCTVKGDILQFLAKQSLSAIIVRCLVCYKRLDTAEKVDCCNADLPFNLVREHWRSYCRICKPK